MKTLFKFCAVLGILAATALSASAQVYQKSTPTTHISGSTSNKVAALTTNSYINIDVPKTENVALFLDSKHLNASGAGDTDQIDVQVFRGINGGVYETNAWFTWVVPTGASTAFNSQVTNVNVLGVPYLRVRLANRSTNSHCTNITFISSFKN